jgi:hypothetical protein
MRILLAFSLSMCVLATEFAPGVIVPESSAPVVPKDRGLSSLLARTRSIPECVKKAATVVLDFHADGSKVSSMAKQVIADTATLATAELVDLAHWIWRLDMGSKSRTTASMNCGVRRTLPAR